jgi:opacity protein-like surface antigen
MKKLVIALAVTSALISIQVFAADTKLVGAYGGVELGYSKVENDAQSTANSLVNEVGGAVTVTQDTSVAIGRAFGGFNINENIAVELGYIRTSDVSQQAAGVAGNSVAYTAKADVSVSGVDYSVLLRPSLASGWNGLFGRVGGHYLEASSDVTVTAASTVTMSRNVSGGGFLVGLGYDTSVSDNIDLRASYTYLNNLAGGDGYANVFSIGVLGKF